MTGIGVLFVVLGVGSLLLPLFNMQFRLMEFVDPYQPFAGFIVAVIGAALVALGTQRKRVQAASAPATAAATAGAPAAEAAAPAATGDQDQA